MARVDSYDNRHSCAGTKSILSPYSRSRADEGDFQMTCRIFMAIVAGASMMIAASTAHAQFGAPFGAIGGLGQVSGQMGGSQKPRVKQIKHTGSSGRRDPDGAKARLSESFGNIGTKIEQRAGVEEKAAIRLQKQAAAEAKKGYAMSAQALNDRAALKLQKANNDMARGKSLVNYSLTLSKPKGR